MTNHFFRYGVSFPTSILVGKCIHFGSQFLQSLLIFTIPSFQHAIDIGKCHSNMDVNIAVNDPDAALA